MHNDSQNTLAVEEINYLRWKGISYYIRTPSMSILMWYFREQHWNFELKTNFSFASIQSCYQCHNRQITRMSTGELLCFHVWKKEIFSAVRQAEQCISIQLRIVSNSPKRAMRQKAAPWPIPAVKLSKLFRKEDKYPFREAQTLNRDKDEHQHQRICSSCWQIHWTLPKRDVKFQNYFCMPPSDFRSMLLTCFTPLSWFPNYFPEPFLKCLGGSKYIIFSFCNHISFVKFKDKICLHGEDQH